MTAADASEKAHRGRVITAPVPAVPADLDATLVERIRNGDRRAEEHLYRRHVRYVGSLLFRLLHNQADVEDATQETFVVALENIHALRDASALRGWLAQIAVSRARRRFRKTRILRALGLHRSSAVDVELLVQTEATEDVRARVSTLLQLLQRLPVEERIAWSLRFIEGQSLKEVAAACRCSLATTKRRVAHADTWLRARYHAEGGT